jgi:hypothetical protein
MLELAIAAIALAWLVMMVTIGLFYVKIDREQREIIRIREKVAGHEESLKLISRFVTTIKGDRSTA